MARRTPAQELAHQMQKLKDMGVTISVRQAPTGAPESRPTGILADAAKAAGIYEEKSN
ncbi:MAG: hypothetical protein JWM23_566 [Microbacteriaceae bacterium]|nr:hypothetical protein [Microbacteriaceae bacterium]